MGEEINLSAAVMRYDDPILYLILKEEIQLDADNIKEISDRARELSDGKSFLLFSDARVKLGISPEGRDAASDQSLLSLVGASAILINNWFVKLLANLFLKFNRTPFPMRLFTDASKAINWLHLQKAII